MDGRLTTIELFKEEMKFSAGHFTIFSASERENLHGHNFTVYAALTGRVGRDGLMADYGPFKRQLRQMCAAWNETLLLPERSPHLRLEREGDELRAHYDGTVMRFMARDVTPIPVANVTIEELARLFGERLTEDPQGLLGLGIEAVTVKCASGPGQWATWTWARDDV
ncbi:6-carboxytetrahydropterin synthase [Pseudenhygromyxa sp. WMMC2535]|uniref:6-pyruvoyl trahydropterin synthase family protein n=1 Tax=Pseudenhygromyxa sp. WMMC2535 TaxID=2712867 RepID=UPI00155711CC|nr:6-carboxytetrahydropterin synthase [Pseudenhygromyxa sp. WMMC2535]NVB38952.1 6-carboxytetrahydropterin synthase [Pseudenhygromyxa sp. WMMC2535]